MRVKVVVTCLLVLGLGVATLQAGFQASDLIYVPVAARNAGLQGSAWRTDLFITNVDTTPVDVVIFYLPTGGFDNSTLFARAQALGGREDQGWGGVEPKLADIPVRGTVSLVDLVQTYFEPIYGNAAGTGGLIVFAFEAGTLDASNGRTLRNVVVQSRTYNVATVWVPDPDNEGEFVERETTYGQTIPGVPWYDTADPAAVYDHGEFTYQWLVGASQNDDYRFNLGLLNCSDPQTTLTVQIQPFQADGSEFTNEEGTSLASFVTLPPLSHIQYTEFLEGRLGLTDVTDVSLKVTVIAWTTTGPDPIPALTSYGSLVDATSNDPTTVLPSFGFPFPVECVWPTPATTSVGVAATGGQAEPGTRLNYLRTRPIELPSN